MPPAPVQVTAIVAYSKGYACACGPGTVHLFEKTDDKDAFKKAREIKVKIDFNANIIFITKGSHKTYFFG